MSDSLVPQPEGIVQFAGRITAPPEFAGLPVQVRSRKVVALTAVPWQQPLLIRSLEGCITGPIPAGLLDGRLGTLLRVEFDGWAAGFVLTSTSGRALGYGVYREPEADEPITVPSPRNRV